MAYSDDYVNNRLTVGESTLRREDVNTNANAQLRLDSGKVHLTFFTARKTETIAHMRTGGGATPAGATPTLTRMGLYLVSDVDGTLNLVASTPAATNLWASAFVETAAALSAPYVKKRGGRYATGLLVVTAAAAPIIPGCVPSGILGTQTQRAPRIAGQITGQTDLPAAITNASLGANTGMAYVELLPTL